MLPSPKTGETDFQFHPTLTRVCVHCTSIWKHEEETVFQIDPKLEAEYADTREPTTTLDGEQR